MENTVVLLTRQVFISVIFSIVSYKQEMRKSPRETTNKNKQFKAPKNWYLIHTGSDNAFKGTDINRTLPSLHGGLFEITLTVPLIRKFWKCNKFQNLECQRITSVQFKLDNFKMHLSGILGFKCTIQFIIYIFAYIVCMQIVCSFIKGEL